MKSLHYCLLPLLFLFTYESFTQELPDRFLDRSPVVAGRGMANYVFTQRGDVPMHVSVWGAVRLGGRYEIPDGTELGQLLSLAGGPGADVRGFIAVADRGGRQQQLRGRTHIRVSRHTGGTNEIVLESRLDNLLEGDMRNFRLQDGDVVMIDQVQRFNFWDALGIVSVSASVILLLDRIFIIF